MDASTDATITTTLHAESIRHRTSSTATIEWVPFNAQEYDAAFDNVDRAIMLWDDEGDPPAFFKINELGQPDLRVSFKKVGGHPVDMGRVYNEGPLEPGFFRVTAWMWDGNDCDPDDL
ncbi:hypothetical protein [Kocuria massiliensis]|uniref:hypothetical protein n=1 Tax=Kocuria massiliensis TaxID=1926282 RepID=UPI00117B2AB7|nr:hypothetical protein [Kocuria massiliensis]